MNQDKVSKQQIIDAALELFRTKGYRATSMADIASACQIKKPSIYHHIESRSELLHAVVKQGTDVFLLQLQKVAGDEQFAVENRLALIAAATRDFYRDGENHSLVIQLVFETQDHSDDLRELIKAFFASWVSIVSALIKKNEHQDAKHDAEDYIAQLEGALLVSTLTQDRQVFERAIDKLEMIAIK